MTHDYVFAAAYYDPNRPHIKDSHTNAIMRDRSTWVKPRRFCLRHEYDLIINRYRVCLDERAVIGYIPRFAAEMDINDDWEQHFVPIKVLDVMTLASEPDGSFDFSKARPLGGKA